MKRKKTIIELPNELFPFKGFPQIKGVQFGNTVYVRAKRNRPTEAGRARSRATVEQVQAVRPSRSKAKVGPSAKDSRGTYRSSATAASGDTKYSRPSVKPPEKIITNKCHRCRTIRNKKDMYHIQQGFGVLWCCRDLLACRKLVMDKSKKK